MSETVADRIDQLADAQPAGSQLQSDLYAAATVWRKHVLGPRAAGDWMLIEEDAPIDVPLDVPVLMAWWDEWCGEWRFEAGHAGSERGGWRHGRATHWRPLPAPPAQISADAHAISDAMRMTDEGEIKEIRRAAPAGDVHDGSEQ